MFAGTQGLVTGEEGGEPGLPEPSLFSFPNPGQDCLTFLRSLPACLFPLHWMPCFLFCFFVFVFFSYFISSKTEDWGYLNEDGELGLAYQGLKQVARSNTYLSSLCLLCLFCLLVSTLSCSSAGVAARA